MKWPTKKLEEIAKVEWGNTSITKKRYVPHGFLAISAAGPDGFLPFADYEGPAIILSAIGAKCGKCFLVDGKWTAIKNTIVVQPDQEQVDIKYLFYFVNDENKWQRVKAAAQPFISLKNAKELQIPLPPLSEQKRIVEKIEKLFAKIDEAERLRAESLAASAALLPSALHQIFSRAKKENWPTKKLGEILELCDSGTWGDESPNGMPLLRSTNMQNAQLILDDLKFIDVPKDKISRYILREGDILITKSSGSVDHIGKSLYITKEMDGKYGFSNFTQRLRVNVKFALPKWIYLIISNPETRDFLLMASQTTTGLRNLKIPALKELKIRLPSLSEQKKIVVYLDALSQKSRELQKLQQQTAADFSALRQSILAQAFNQNS